MYRAKYRCRHRFIYWSNFYGNMAQKIAKIAKIIPGSVWPSHIIPSAFGCRPKRMYRAKYRCRHRFIYWSNFYGNMAQKIAKMAIKVQSDHSVQMNNIASLLNLLILCISSPCPGCKTSGGLNPGKPCIFPFKFEGKTYFGCPPEPDAPGKTWCSTKVDSFGNHVVKKVNNTSSQCFKLFLE